jgi:hypothetical protein
MESPCLGVSFSKMLSENLCFVSIPPNTLRKYSEAFTSVGPVLDFYEEPLVLVL